MALRDLLGVAMKERLFHILLIAVGGAVIAALVAWPIVVEVLTQ